MKTNLKTILPTIGLLSATPSIAEEVKKTEPLKYVANIALRTQYIAENGIPADTNPVIQPTITAQHANGLYWGGGVSLKTNQENPSNQIVAWLGYHQPLRKNEHLNAAITYFDIENPNLLDGKGNVLNPEIQYQKNNIYAIAEGFLTSLGNGHGVEIGVKRKDRLGAFNINSNTGVRHSDGPAVFPEIVSSRVKLVISSDKYLPDNTSLEIDIDQPIKQEVGDLRETEVTASFVYNF